MSGKSKLNKILKSPLLFNLLFLHNILKSTRWKLI